MRTILLSMLLSTSTFAAEYACQAQLEKFELKVEKDLNPSLVVKDAQMGQILYSGFAKEVQSYEGRMDIIFETSSTGFLQLRFKSEEVSKSADTLYGLARGYTGASFIDQSIKCFKKAI